MKRRETNRKVRSDKKREIQPVVHINIYETISRLSYITVRPIKDVGEQICMDGLQSKKVMDYLSTFFRRNFRFDDHITYCGDITNEPLKVDRGKGDKTRISLRFPTDSYDRIKDLSYSLDMTVGSATAFLLEVSVKQSGIVQSYLKKYMEQTLDDARLKQLKEVIKYINQNNPYREKVTLPMVIDYLVSQLVDSTKNVKQVISEWLDDWIE